MHTYQKSRKLWALVLLGLAAVTGTTALAVGGSKLIINGRIASAGVRIIDGTAYVPVADVAKALDMNVIPISGGYEIKKAGGTSQLQGLNGKIGDVLFDGKWRFQVLGISAPATYTMKTSADASQGYYSGNLVAWNSVTHVITPSRGYQLVVVQSRVTNAVAQKRTLWVGGKRTNTALADAEGDSHPPIAYDFEGAPIQSKPLLQGAKLDFNIIFSVPVGTKMKDLIFTLVANGDLENKHDVRVSLASGE